jgi:AraC-like DNA-binding protein
VWSHDRPSEIDALIQELSAQAPHDGRFVLQVPGLRFIKASRVAIEPAHDIVPPGLCLVIQGAMQVSVGSVTHRHDRTTMLVLSIALPIAWQVVEASSAHPFLCLWLDLDAMHLHTLWTRAGGPRDAEPSHVGAMTSSPHDPSIANACLRLLQIVRRPKGLALLAPILADELQARLLLDPAGAGLLHFADLRSPLHRITMAAAHIRKCFDQALQVKDLAAAVNMSSSTFHHHFKAIACISPLQYQKAIRLITARRLMCAATHDASEACRAVGYASATQFSREYARMFGDAPARDVARLLDRLWSAPSQPRSSA